jgi:hypothetical protein
MDRGPASVAAGEPLVRSCAKRAAEGYRWAVIDIAFRDDSSPLSTSDCRGAGGSSWVTCMRIWAAWARLAAAAW